MERARVKLILRLIDIRKAYDSMLRKQLQNYQDEVWISRQLLTYTNGIYKGKDEDDYNVHRLDDVKERVYTRMTKCHQ